MYRKICENQEFLVHETFFVSYLMTLSPTWAIQRRVTEWQSEINLKN